MTYVQVERECVAIIFKDPQMSKSYIWHLCLGHIGHDGINAIMEQKIGIEIEIALVSKLELCRK